MAQIAGNCFIYKFFFGGACPRTPLALLGPLALVLAPSARAASIFTPLKKILGRTLSLVRQIAHLLDRLDARLSASVV